MAFSAQFGQHLNRVVVAVLIILCTLPAYAQQRVGVAVIGDGPADRFTGRQQIYIDELLALTENEFDVRIDILEGNWTKESIERAVDEAYANPEIDLLLITGFVANQVVAIRRDFPKPTFLPIIIDTGLLEGGATNGTSGIRNLNYLSAYADFADDLDTLARIAPYRKLALMVDAGLSSAIPLLRERAFAAAEERGIELIEVTHDGVDHQLMNQLPAGTDAVIVAGLPRMPVEEFDLLIDAINRAGLPSYSFAGVEDVERGLLMTNSEPRDVDRQARLNALNIQAVMLGGRAEDQPTRSRIEEQLTINMRTARQIGVSPNFDVLNEAVLLNQEQQVFGQLYGLVDIANRAIEQNQDLLAETFGVRAGFEEIARARANLLPQLDLSTIYSSRKDSPSVAAGLFAERSTDAALGLTQLIYSDSASANLTIQRQIQRSREASLQQFRLDVIQAATVSYYSVLNARSQLAVQENNLQISRANLELAEDRVRLGTSTPADVYRWQAEVARARILVLNARSALNQAWDTLSRVLHLPQGERIALKEASFNEPFVMAREEFDELVQSPADYGVFSRLYIERALRQAPELEQLNAQIDAKRRELTSQRRAYWLPDFSIGGQATSNLSQSGLGAGPSAGEDFDDWNFGVQATLPLFSGGLKKANVSRANFELRQLESLRTATEERIEEEVRIQLHSAAAAYQQINLSATAAEASRKNFELVSDAYARGTVTVIELLDAQDTSLTASAAAAESLYNFLITIMSLQRAVGGYDFLATPELRSELAEELRRRLARIE